MIIICIRNDRNYYILIKTNITYNNLDQKQIKTLTPSRDVKVHNEHSKMYNIAKSQPTSNIGEL